MSRMLSVGERIRNTGRKDKKYIPVFDSWVYKKGRKVPV